MTIRADRLTKRYGPSVALDRLTLEAPRGILGLLGPNGAGKTTFLRLIMGLISPSDGRLDRGGVSPSQIGYLPEHVAYPPRFRVREYLNDMARLAGLASGPSREQVASLLEQLDLAGVAQKRLGSCSRGMLQRVGLAQAMLGDPPVLLLDEPVLGLDPAGQKIVRDQIVAAHQAGKTVLLASHNLGEVTRICTHIALLKRGQLVRHGPLESILPSRDEVVIRTGLMPEGLASDLRAMSAGVLASEGRVQLLGEGVQHKDRVLRALLDAGVDIQHLSEVRATLEEVYLEATE